MFMDPETVHTVAPCTDRVEPTVTIVVRDKRIASTCRVHSEDPDLHLSTEATEKVDCPAKLLRQFQGIVDSAWRSA